MMNPTRITIDNTRDGLKVAMHYQHTYGEKADGKLPVAGVRERDDLTLQVLRRVVQALEGGDYWEVGGTSTLREMKRDDVVIDRQGERQ